MRISSYMEQNINMFLKMEITTYGLGSYFILNLMEEKENKCSNHLLVPNSCHSLKNIK